MTTLNLQPPRVPLVDPKTGIITREWYRFITDSFARQGGHDAPTNSDLDVAMPEDSGVAELEFLARTWVNDQSQEPPVVSIPSSELEMFATPIVQVLYETLESMQSEVRKNSELIAVLMRQVEDIKQGTLS